MNRQPPGYEPGHLPFDKYPATGNVRFELRHRIPNPVCYHYTTFPLATMKGIEPLPPERQSGTLTITPHSHFASKKNRSHEPKNKTNWRSLPISMKACKWIARIELAPIVWKTIILTFIRYPHVSERSAWFLPLYMIIIVAAYTA